MIELRKLTAKSTDFREIHRVYEKVFPANERLPLSFLRMRARAGKAEFYSIYDQQKWVGFFYTIYDRRIAYILFLAIDPEVHSQGYGSTAVTLIKQLYADRIVSLSTERPATEALNNSQRLRRHQFYATNGFVKAGFYTVEKDNEKFDFLSPTSDVRPYLFQQLMNRYLTKRHRRYLPFKIISE